MTAGRAEIDAAVLTGRVRMGAIERERSQHGPVDGPGPRARDGHRQQQRAHDQENETPHDFLLVARLANKATVARPSAVVNTGYKVRR